IAASTAFTSSHTDLRKASVPCSSPGSIIAAFCSTLSCGLRSRLSTIQLSRSVTIALRNSSLARSYPQSRNAPSVNFMMLPLWTSVTMRFLLASAYSIARRTSRFVPVGEIGLMATPESRRICFGPPPSISLFKYSISFFTSGVPDFHILGIFAVDDHVHALGMFHRGRNAREITHRPDACVEIEQLPQRDVQRPDSSAHRRSQRPFNRNAKISNRVHRLVGQPLLEFFECFFSREHFKPGNLALPAVRLFDRRVENAPRRLPDVASGPIPLDKRNDRTVGYNEFTPHEFNRFPILRNGPAVIFLLHVDAPQCVVTLSAQARKNNTVHGHTTLRPRSKKKAYVRVQITWLRGPRSQSRKGRKNVAH